MYKRLKLVDFGASRSGLNTVSWSIDGGSTWSTTGVTEVAPGIGSYKCLIDFPDNFTGVLLWKTGETIGQRFSAEEINPGIDEYSDVKLSGVPSSVWANGNRTITAFSFSVTVSGFSGGPTFRNQDLLVNPTWEDCLASAWAAANAKEVENDTAKTFVRYTPGDHPAPMRSFVLTVDQKGNPVGRS